MVSKLAQRSGGGSAAQASRPLDIRRHRAGHVVGIVLDLDIAEVFDSPETVHRFLRSTIEAMPTRTRDR